MTLRAACGGLLLAALLWTSAAARVLVVTPRYDTGSAARQTSQEWTTNAVLVYLNGLVGRDYYRVMPYNAVLTDSLRAGKVQEPDGTWTAYDAVFHVGVSVNNITAAPYQWMSMTLYASSTTKAPWVPQLFIASAGETSPFTTAAGCSTGSNGVTGTLPESLSTVYVVSDKTKLWREPSVYRPPVTPTTRMRGCFRPLLNIGASMWSLPGAGRSLSGNWDSLLTAAPAADTTCLWVIYNRTANGATPLSLESAAGNGHWRICAPSVFLKFGTDYSAGDAKALMYAFAWMDSLTGGKVFENAAKFPVRIGFVIDDGWKKYNVGNVYVDTVGLKATIDSLRVLGTMGAKFDLGVELDSVAAYPEMRAWWSRLDPYIHYSPHIHYGTTAVATPYNRSATKAIDLLAARRPYAKAYGPLGTSADTSLCGQLKASLELCVAAFGADKVDRVFIAASGRNYLGTATETAWAGAIGADSIYWCFEQAGYVGLRFDTDSHVYDRSRGQLTPYSYTWTQTLSRHYGPVGSTPTRGLAFLGMAGVQNGDTEKLWNGNQVYKISNGITNGIFGGHNSNSNYNLASSDITTYANTLYRNVQSPVCLAVSHVSDFGCSSTGMPTRPSYWSYKHLTLFINALNSICGKTVMMIDWPENMVK